MAGGSPGPAGGAARSRGEARVVPRRATVLEEGAYAGALEAIIERDFYPEVPRLQSKVEWLEATRSGDPARIAQAQRNITSRRAGVPTPVHYAPPRPLERSLETPGPEAEGRGWDDGEEEDEGDAGSEDEAGGAGPRPPPDMSLDQFCGEFTGEDNASFAKVLAKNNARRRARYGWLLEGPKGAAAEERDPDPAAATDGYGTSGQPLARLQGWPYAAKNNLYYDPAPPGGLRLTNGEEGDTFRRPAPRKAINHAGTRLPDRGHPAHTPGVFPLETPSTSRSESAGGPGGERPGGGPGHPKYGYVPSPTPTAGGAGAAGGAEGGEGDGGARRPAFRVNETPKRDRVGRALALNAAAATRKRKGRFSRGPSPSPRRARSKTPQLTPAGRKVLSSMRGARAPSVSADIGLRSSYSGLTPRPASRPASRAATPAPEGAGQGLPDDLLRLG